MKTFFIFVYLFIALSLNALGLDLISSPNIIALGEIYLLSDTPDTAFYQPAKRNEGISLSHSNPHGFWDLNIFQIASQFTLFNEIFTAGTIFMDNNQISDKLFYLGYNKNINNLTFGANIKYYNQSIQGYDTLDAFTLNIGAIWTIRAFNHGLSYSNVSHTSKVGIDLPTLFKYECMIIPFDKTKFALAVEKEKNFEMRYAFAASHKLSSIISINSGFITNPSQFSAGFVISINDLDISVGVRTHGQLGYTQAAGIAYGF
ncbi:MAG: hypothetical protein FWG98_07975 [Candidatus Cloacimonetes bacterium]|nr:hypothetical protein [Candidatus Cloacimonadota bacterium]